jgi:hypothetical protein
MAFYNGLVQELREGRTDKAMDLPGASLKNGLRSYREIRQELISTTMKLYEVRLTETIHPNTLKMRLFTQATEAHARSLGLSRF